MNNVVIEFAFQAKKLNNQADHASEIANHEKEGCIPTFAWIPVKGTKEITAILLMINQTKKTLLIVWFLLKDTQEEKSRTVKDLIHG